MNETYTYSTIDFSELFTELKTELERLENGYCVYDKERPERVSDYNQITTALLILRKIESR